MLVEFVLGTNLFAWIQFHNWCQKRAPGYIHQKLWICSRILLYISKENVAILVSNTEVFTDKKNNQERIQQVEIKWKKHKMKYEKTSV